MERLITEFVNALLMFDRADELKVFLEDVMTSKELEDCALRWKVARLLAEGDSYLSIQDQTGLSTTTIARISKWLQEGSGGYGLALKRLGISLD